MPFAHKKCGSLQKTDKGDYVPLFMRETQEEYESRRVVLPPLVAAASAAQLHCIDVMVEETEREHGPETVQRLLDQPYGPDNYTALHLAVTRRDLRTCADSASVSELQYHEDGVNATQCHRDAVDVAVRAVFATPSFDAGVHLVKKGARTEVGDARGVSPSELAIHMQQPRLGDYLRRVRRVGREVVSTRKDQDLERAALLQYARLERAIETGQGFIEDKASSLSVIRGGDCAPDQETRTGTTALFVACHAGDSKLVHNCVEINQCVGCTRQFFTKSFLGDDAPVLARSSGEEPASPRHRAGVASMAWRTKRRFSTNAP